MLAAAFDRERENAYHFVKRGSEIQTWMSVGGEGAKWTDYQWLITMRTIAEAEPHHAIPVSQLIRQLERVRTSGVPSLLQCMALQCMQLCMHPTQPSLCAGSVVGRCYVRQVCTLMCVMVLVHVSCTGMCWGCSRSPQLSSEVQFGRCSTAVINACCRSTPK